MRGRGLEMGTGLTVMPMKGKEKIVYVSPKVTIE